MSKSKLTLAGIGLRAKTGRAVVVVLVGPATSPLVWKRSLIDLVDPKIPATSQPYHEVMELRWPDALVAVQPLVKAIENVATNRMAELASAICSAGFTVRGVGIVGSGDRKLEKIGNPHIRAHAAEGVLFRSVLESAAKGNELDEHFFTEKELDQLAISQLHLEAATLKHKLLDLGRAVGPPWRTDERIAATAAWLALTANKRSRVKSASKSI